MFFHTKNLVSQVYHSGVNPWDFKPSELPSEKICKDKQSRQEWYRSNSTCWMFYSGVEPANSNVRTSKENPPRLLHALCADYDAKIPDSRIDEAVAAMSHKPSFIERSLGGNARLVWLLPFPLIVDDYDFAVSILIAAVKWLQLDFLPALDGPAFIDPCRLYCAGKEWRSTGHGPLSAPSVQAFFVECGKKFRFKGEEKSSGIPLEIIEPALRERYPAFGWPGDFVVESSGPSFWVPGSVSPLSAIVKENGMFSFADHAEKPFYTWTDLLGPEFVAKYEEDSIASATADIFWTGKHFWRKIGSSYCSLAKDELLTFFNVECRLKKNRIQDALSYIHNNGRVSGAAPFVFRPSGRITFQNRTVLNTYNHHVMPPATEKSEWGPQGKFPFLSLHFEALFDPPEQLPHFLAWWRWFYISGVDLKPMPGQNTFLLGGVDIGKTLTNRAIVGRSVGGFADASDFFVGNGSFNSELFEVPCWVIDDENCGESSQAQGRFQAMLKKTAANQEFKFHKKFEVGSLTEWMGRVLITANLDFVSSRVIGPLDSSVKDKTNLFKCPAESKIRFPSRHILAEIIEKELPYLLRWLLEWEPPAFVMRSVRYGFKAFHEPSLLDHAHQGGKSAPFRELLLECLKQYFQDNPEVAEWRGTVTNILRLLQSDPLNEHALRSFRVETASRHLEAIQRDKVVPCFTEVGEFKARIWVFSRFGDPLPSAPDVPSCQPINIFSK